jgi:hypothetical protein
MKIAGITKIEYGDKVLDLANKQEIYTFLFDHKVRYPFKASQEGYLDLVNEIFDRSLNGEFGFNPEALEAIKAMPLVWYELLVTSAFRCGIEEAHYMSMMSAIKNLRDRNRISDFIYVPSKKNNQLMRSNF